MVDQDCQPGPGCTLREFRPFATLEAETLGALESECRVKRFRKGETLIREGDALSHVGCVRQGILKMQKSLSDGRQHIVGLLVDSDVFGQEFGALRQFEIEAATDAEICFFERDLFDGLMENSPELERAMLMNILRELDRARDWMIILSCQKVTGRLAGFFMILLTQFAEVDHVLQSRDGQLEIRIPISRTDLAHLLGSRTESISRALHALEDEGLLQILRPDLVRILDMEALAAEAGDAGMAGRVRLADIRPSEQPRS